MDVQTIVNRILDFGLDTTDADNELESRILNDVNEVYRQLQHYISPIATADYMETTSVTITDGVGTVPEQIRVFSVHDTGNGSKKLDETDVLALEESDPALATTGSPSCFYITGGTTLNTYPINSTTVRFRYFPTVNALTLASVESDIRIPAHLHDVLVDGGIYLTALREQGFHDRLDRGEKMRNWMESNSQLSAYMNNRNRKVRRTSYVDF